MKEIAIYIENAVQFYSVEPLLNAMDAASMEYDIILPDWDTPDTPFFRKGGWPAIEESLEEVLKQRRIPFIKGSADKIYRISMSPYPIGWVKSVFKVAYCYGFACKPGFSVAPENKLYYDVILCHGNADAEFFSAYTKTCIIGEPKLLDYKRTELQHKKPKLLYLPTYSELSSIDDAVPQLEKLSDEYEIIAKAHHGTSYLTNETGHRDILSRAFTKIYDAKTPLYDLLAEADIVLSDNSGAILDAMAAGVPVARFATTIPQTIGEFVPLYLEFVGNGILPSTDNPDEIEAVLKAAMTKEVRDSQKKAAAALYFDPEEGKKNFLALMDELLCAHEKTRFFSLQCAKNAYREEKRKELEEMNLACSRLSVKCGEISAEKELLRLESEKTLEELRNALKEKLECQKELEARNKRYDNLYAYSASRDAEFNRMVNSRSYKFFSKFIKKPLHIGYKIAAKLLRMFKDLAALDFRELAREFYMPVIHVITQSKARIQFKRTIKELNRNIAGKRVIIFPPVTDWHMRLFQRPQQLALAYARKENTAVIYLTCNMQDDHVEVTEQLADDLWLMNSFYEKELVEILGAAKEVIVSISWTVNMRYIDVFHPDKIIYEYIDELEIFDFYGPDMIADHGKMMNMANVTVCTATKLYKQALGKARHPILSPNAGDYEFFAKTSETEINPLIAEKIKGYKCVLGYYGALASWFDYDLVKEVARRHADWLFVLVGINYDKTLDQSGIDSFDNIVYIPPQPYPALPGFLNAFDIATIPFFINEITLSTSPVKLFEYMAGGKPILTSKMPECLKYESVRTYADADEFCRIVEEYMSMRSDDPYWEVLKQEAMENTWDARAEQILKAIDET